MVELQEPTYEESIDLNKFTDYIKETGDFNILAYSVSRNNDFLRKLIIGQFSNFYSIF